jgi:hypothetical protein
MDFLKTVTGKVITGLVSAVVITLSISWWNMSDATKHWILSGSGRIFAWLGLVLIVPWAAFFIIGWVARFQTNTAGGILVLVLTVGEAVVLLKLFGWNLGGPMAWVFFAVGALFAGVYNLFTCDWIAERAE